jgi:hypothetical protein
LWITASPPFASGGGAVAGQSSIARRRNGAVLVPGSDRIEAARLALKHNHGWQPGAPFGFAELSPRPPRRPLDTELLARCNGTRAYHYRNFLGQPVAIVSIFRLWHAHAAADVEVLALQLGLSADSLPGR